MFEKDEPDFTNHCRHCQWQHTQACPYDKSFIGRATFDLNRYPQLCHRFVMTKGERDRRWQITMDKLHENLTIGENDDF